MRGDCLRSFVSIVTSAVSDVEPSVFHMVDEAVFFIDTFSLIIHLNQFMGSTFSFAKLLDRFFYIRKIRL